ncbi:MAG: neutral/alkaline non-lysosomal ceramidase N-terminal domain-containing protein, partial [Pirellulales bacterium]|nr:neutral/alkaline non-lysosomal ceramidase N-terminal domain-containing protein [Pirellulales bacterium]
SSTAAARADLKAGAAVVDVTPNQLPVLVNGGMLSRTADTIRTRVNARALVLDDGKVKLALVVVDSCMIPKALLDDAKKRAAARTNIPADHIMISATHTHTAPSSFGALGTEADLSYLPLLRERMVEAIVQAHANLQPAEIGWGAGEAAEFTALRRWVRRPDRLDNDPFGNPTVRANMHSARNPDDVTGPSGPEDPELSMIAVRSEQQVPIAVLCNFSMHYFGDQPISADYFGLFCDGMAKYAASEAKVEPQEVVGIMSHGCSGDIWRRDYMTWKSDQPDPKIDTYTQALLEIAKRVYDSIEYSRQAELAMAEARLPMRYRIPDAQRLKWAREITDAMADQKPADRVEVYAREQVLLHQLQATEVVVQAIRIGEIGIATTPCETYALTGLKIKQQSPLKHMMVIELANGADGYIPPPEQHRLGGYNTWAARSAGLEVQAEPRIVSTALGLLE